MGSLAVSTNDPVVKKMWDEMRFREVRKAMVIGSLMGPSSDYAIYEKSNIKKGEGDAITFTIFPRQEADVITGSSGLSLEGKEGKIKYFTDQVTLEEYKLGFRYKCGLDEHRPWFSVSEENAIGLNQVSSEVMDDLWFEKMLDAPSAVYYGGGKANAAALTNADKLTPAYIRRLSAMASAGFPNFATSLNARTTYPFQKIKALGKGWYILYVHPYALYDIKNNAEYQGYLKEALARSNDNPIFSGAVAIIDNVVVKEHENIPIASNGTVFYCKGIFMGAGSSIWAWGQKPVTVDKSFGYDEERGIARKFIAGIKKTKFQFTSVGPKVDYGSCGAYFTITDLANAQ